jgi:L-lactate dehydrogenase complex protein LldG
MNTLNAKNTILQKLRNAHVAVSNHIAQTAHYQWPTIAEPMEQFKTLLRNNHAIVIDTHEADVGQIIHQIIQQGNYHNVIASDRVRMQYPDLMDATAPLPAGRIEVWKDFIFDSVEVGITSASCAIAATGSVVLRTGADEPRSLSLVPPCHIVIVREETLYNDLAEVICVQGWGEGMPTNIVLVSGPSKTADIQQTLAYGAHGPKCFYVVIVRGEKTL